MPLEIRCALWNLQAAYCRYLPPCPHSPLYFSSLPASCRAQTDILQQAGEREEKKRGEGRREEVLILSNWGAPVSQLTCRRPGIKCIPFSLCYPGTDSLQSPRFDRPNWGLSPSAHLSHSIKHPFLVCVLTHMNTHTVYTQAFNYWLLPAGYLQIKICTTPTNTQCIFGIYNKRHTSFHLLLNKPRYIYFKYLLSQKGLFLYQGKGRFYRNIVKWQHCLF